MKLQDRRGVEEYVYVRISFVKDLSMDSKTCTNEFITTRVIESRGTLPQSQIDVFRILHVQGIYKY